MAESSRLEHDSADGALISQRHQEILTLTARLLVKQKSSEEVIEALREQGLAGPRDDEAWLENLKFKFTQFWWDRYRRAELSEIAPVRSRAMGVLEELLDCGDLAVRRAAANDVLRHSKEDMERFLEGSPGARARGESPGKKNPRMERAEVQKNIMRLTTEAGKRENVVGIKSASGKT
jgi:hypothetical protein